MAEFLRDPPLQIHLAGAGLGWDLLGAGVPCQPSAQIDLWVPAGEEIFKSLVLLYLVRRGAMTSFVDGAVYGFASGIGFAIVENMLYLSRVDVDTGVVIGTTRAFLASVLHGSTSAIVGMAVGGFPLGRVKHPLLAWLIGLAVAIGIHTTFNVTVFQNFVS
ncbi:MAG: PrsW family intramembrane metalloprotease, partial [Betaproteobacteria bacterium]